jgi:hypothetical protein
MYTILEQMRFDQTFSQSVSKNKIRHAPPTNVCHSWPEMWLLCHAEQLFDCSTYLLITAWVAVLLTAPDCLTGPTMHIVGHQHNKLQQTLVVKERLEIYILLNACFKNTHIEVLSQKSAATHKLRNASSWDACFPLTCKLRQWQDVGTEVSKQKKREDQ